MDSGRTQWKYLVLAGIIAILALLLITALNREHQPYSVKSDKSEAKYFCPMHPSIVSDKPGRCPICGMELQPFQKQKTDLSSHRDRAAVSLTTQQQKLLGLTTAIVGKRDLTQSLRVRGSIAFDPELYSALQEYRSAQELPDGRLKQELVAASKTKLKLIGVAEQALANMLGASDNLGLLLPQGKLWVYAEVPEIYASKISVGLKVNVSSANIGVKLIPGRIASIDNVINTSSRTVRARIDLEQQNTTFRPDMFVDVELLLSSTLALAVPENAVIHTGEHDLVLVAQADNFVPREVALGESVSGYIPVLAGLEEGETVVTSANFLIDSESRLQAALKQFAIPQ